MNDEELSQLPQEKVCIIWLHGLGADSSDMKGLARELRLPVGAVKHTFLDAPIRAVTINQGMQMRAWYDIVGDQLTHREDEAGIHASQKQILEAVKAEQAAGFSAEQIMLAGFSQGGAMALYAALHQKEQLAGVIALSAYLPLARKTTTASLPKDTPFFIACGRLDPIVLPAWTEETLKWVSEQGYHKASFHEYTMQHTICHEEIADLSAWLLVKIEGMRQ